MKASVTNKSNGGKIAKIHEIAFMRECGLTIRTEPTRVNDMAVLNILDSRQAPLGVGSGELLERRAKNREKLRRWRARNPKRWRIGYDKDKAREKLKAWRKANPEKHRAQGQRRYKKHPEKMRAKAKAYYHRNREAAAARARARYQAKRKANPDAVRKYEQECREKYRGTYRARDLKNVREISESYVRRLLNNETKIPGSFWPKQVVECYAVNLKIKRLCRNLKTSANSANNSLTPSNG